MKTDNAQLTGIIEKCFELAMNDALTPKQQAAFLATGKRLRRSAVNLMSASFRQTTKEVAAANRVLAARNRELATTARSFQRAATMLAKLNKLVAMLDSLLKLSARFT